MQSARAFVPWRVLLSLSLFFCASRAANAAPPAGVTLNACGCYQDEAGVCFCEKKSKCGCEGECEPKGCEEKRTKERQKELDEEVKRAKARDTQSSSDAVTPEDARSKRAAERPKSEARAKESGRPADLATSAPDDDANSCPPCPCMEGKAKKKPAKAPPSK
jgi:hypothetical protein